MLWVMEGKYGWGKGVCMSEDHGKCHFLRALKEHLLIWGSAVKEMQRLLHLEI